VTVTDMAADAESPAAGVAPAPDRTLRRVLVTIIAVAALVLAGCAGWLLRGDSSSASMPAPGSVDAGFAQDMTVHHIQAVTMAGYERDNTRDPQLRVLAFDIETSQQFQVGQMSGWLDSWGLSRNNPHPMLWMGAEHAEHVVNGLMPGMATPDQMTELANARGKALDVLFLQLMIRHHQGGLPMAQYAVQHASEPYVRTLAGQVISAQTSEIVQMEQLLRQRGGTPLEKPDV
jgi:uncharacterized protein (DUF305 family)